MAILEINGRRIEVDDSFRNLTPEQQQAAVEQIARSMGQAQEQTADGRPALRQDPGMEDLWAPSIPQSDTPEPGAVPTLPGALGGIQNNARAISDAITQGATFGFADEIAAGLASPVRSLLTGEDLPTAYGQQLDDIRGIEAATAAEAPIASTAGNIAGAVGTGIGLARGGVSLMNGARPTALSMGMRGAAEGAIYGGLHGFGAGETMDDRIEQAASGAAWGAGLGGALGAGSGALANRAAQRATPSIDDLRGEAGALYQQAQQSGANFSRDSVRTIADDITARAMSDGLDATLHPGATAAVRRLQEAAQQGMTPQQAQTMRRVLSAAARDPNNPDQARIARNMIEMFDDFVETSLPQLGPANQLYSRARKAETIEDIFTRARDQLGANYNNAGYVTALRQQFRSLLNNKRQIRGFSEAERGAIRDFVRGGPVENVLRMIGRMAPTGSVSGMATLGTPTLIGSALGNPQAGALAGIGMAGAGYAARGAGNMIAQGQANRIAQMIRGGGAPQLSPARQAITDALIAGQSAESRNIPEGSRGMLRALIAGMNP